MSRKGQALGLSSITVEGGLINPDKLLEVAATAPNDKAAKSYHCPKGVNLRDEISRYFRIAQAEWQIYERAPVKTTEINQKFVEDLLSNAFGFDDLSGFVRQNVEGHSYPIHFEDKGGRVPIVVSPPETSETQKDAYKIARADLGDGPGGRISKRRPDAVLQEWLNESEPALWGLVFVGDRVRVMRDNASFTRPAYIEADLGAIFRDEIFSDFTALWLLIHASRFGEANAPVTDCALERWREEGVKSGTAARDRLRGNVELALLALGQGFLDANEDLRTKLETSQLTEQVWFEQLLRIVYRLIFLAVAEDRDLLHTPKASQSTRRLYEDGYSFDALRERATRRQSRDPHSDAYEAFKVTLSCLERGEEKLGLPALGGLFDRTLTPDLGHAKIANRFFLEAIFRLSFVIEDKRRIKINWRDMATEELGSVYEGLLELVPIRSDGGRTFGFAGADEAKGNDRKTSGSYYTPDSLVQTLLDSALDPVLERAEAEGEKAILALSVIDPACGSGHFLLGAARRMATKLATLRDNENPDFQHALRDVVRNCIYGVDRNPMAVELAKVALWIEAVEPGMPLGFLDANIKCGDSLLGVFDLEVLHDGIPDDAYKPLTGDNKNTCTYFKKKNQSEKSGQGELGLFGQKSALPQPPPLNKLAVSLRGMPEDTPRQIRAKAKAFDAMVKNAEMWNWRLACDIYIAAFVLAKPGGIPENPKTSLVPTTGDLWAQLSTHENPYPQLVATCQDVSLKTRAFHWPLEFPDIMATGGFSVVIGNPPWEKVQVEDEEFFSLREPDIAILKGQNRKRKIAALEDKNPSLYFEFQDYQHLIKSFDLFAKSSGRFGDTGVGKLNLYALFAELSTSLISNQGVSGLILPIGIVTDHSTRHFFDRMLADGKLSKVLGFENEEFIFPTVHHAFRFVLFISSGSVLDETPEFSFFNRQTTSVFDESRSYRLTYSSICNINPNTKNSPIFRSAFDANLNKRIYEKFPVIFDESNNGNPWEVTIRRMFNPTDDSDLFIANSDQLKPSLPLYEAKMIHQYNHRFGTYVGQTEAQRRQGKLPESPSRDLKNPNYEVMPRYWVTDDHYRKKNFNKSSRNWSIAFRDITNAIAVRTVISCILPDYPTVDPCRNVFVDPNISAKLTCCLLACFNSVVFDYFARQKVSANHLAIFIFKQLPVIPPREFTPKIQHFIAQRVVDLTCNSSDMQNFLEEVFPEKEIVQWESEKRLILEAELNAIIAKLYTIERDELLYILDPNNLFSKDYPSETFRVLRDREIKECGEYRTQRLVLESWDRFTADGTFRELGLMS